jgi:hypothetical protein
MAQEFMNAFRRIPLFTLVAGISMTIGFLVPVVFEFTEQPAARSRHPSMEWAAILTVALTCVACVLVAWLSKRPEQPPDGRARKLQFGLWKLFVVMTLSAVLLAVAKWLEISWLSALITVLALGVLGWSNYLGPDVRSRAGSLLASLFCPFVWMIAYNVPFRTTSGLAVAIPIAPAILPAEILRRFTSDVGVDGNVPIAGVIVVGELLLGAWLARRGGKLFVAYLLCVLVASCASTWVMHAGYRM